MWDNVFFSEVIRRLVGHIYWCCHFIHNTALFCQIYRQLKFKYILQGSTGFCTQTRITLQSFLLLNVWLYAGVQGAVYRSEHYKIFFLCAKSALAVGLGWTPWSRLVCAKLSELHFNVSLFSNRGTDLGHIFRNFSPRLGNNDTLKCSYDSLAHNLICGKCGNLSELLWNVSVSSNRKEKITNSI